MDDARATLAAAIGARVKEIVFTSGATESNNLALHGVAERYRAKGRHIISVVTEHPSVLDPLARLGSRGFEVTLLPVIQSPGPEAGRVRPEQVAEAIRKETILVSVMLANNEIGAIQPLAEIGQICHERGRAAAQRRHAGGWQDPGRKSMHLQVDLMSFTAHKLYGPKGIGALYVRRTAPAVRLQPLIDGGGQEGGLRSGTLNVPGIVGFARAVELCLAEMSTESSGWAGSGIGSMQGFWPRCPESAQWSVLDRPEWRLPGNLNVSFPGVEGQALLLEAKTWRLSSGSACTSENPEPSHVLRSLGIGEDAAHGSVRFGLGRFNTAEEVEYAIPLLSQTFRRLLGFSHPIS